MGGGTEDGEVKECVKRMRECKAVVWQEARTGVRVGRHQEGESRELWDKKETEWNATDGAIFFGRPSLIERELRRIFLLRDLLYLSSCSIRKVVNKRGRQ